ncbi:MAG: hypothetical protein LJE87_03100 [Deltaproteobacteria bacterium]|nr:hypothetical protein [Deltaproteobacteria bacterium]
MAVLPGVLGCRPLRRTIQVRLGTNTLRLPGATTILVVSRQQFMKYPGEKKTRRRGDHDSSLTASPHRIYYAADSSALFVIWPRTARTEWLT